PDIAGLCPYQSGSTVSVLLGNGDGTFQTGIVSELPGPAPDFALGDFNFDGKLDVIATNVNNNSVTLLPGDGEGTFSVAQSIPVGHFPQPVAVADFNGDGVIDVAAGNPNDKTVTILINQTLTGSTTVSVSPAAASHSTVAAPLATASVSAIGFT